MSTERTYKVFAHVTGLVVFELLFWAAIGGIYLLTKSAVPQFELHQPSAWPALLMAPILLLFFARHYLWKQRRISQSVDLKLSKTLWPNARPRRSIWKFLIWRTALAFLAMGMLAPKTGTRLKEMEAKGVDIMIALDVSRSMMAEDLGMSRLDLAKRTIERIVGSLDGDRAGLVVFAGDAYVQAPLHSIWLQLSCFWMPLALRPSRCKALPSAQPLSSVWPRLTPKVRPVKSSLSSPTAKITRTTPSPGQTKQRHQESRSTLQVWPAKQAAPFLSLTVTDDKQATRKTAMDSR